MADLIRVVRILEYVGSRTAIEKHFEHVTQGQKSWGNGDNVIVIRAATLGTFPEILEENMGKDLT